MSDVIAIDFETFYSKKLKYSVKGTIPERYCDDPRFDAYLVSVSDGENRWAGSPRDLNWSLLRGKTLLAHNKRFDYPVWLELAKRGIVPAPDFKEFHCTANMTSYLCNMRSLAQSVEHLLKVKVSKDVREDASEKHWPKDFSAEEQKAMLEYARRDADFCWMLFHKFGAQWPEAERRLSNQTIAQGMRGVKINAALLDDYVVRTHDALKKTESLIPWIAEADDDAWDDFNTKPTSSKCIAEQCRRSGIPCPPVASEDEDGYVEWEETYSRQHRWIKAVTSWRSLNKLYKTFLKMKNWMRSDGTMPFSLKYFGAHTGRWSGDSGLNLQNPRKRPLLLDESGLEILDEKQIADALDFHRRYTVSTVPADAACRMFPELEGVWPKYVGGVLDFRALIVPREGKKMIVSDLSQIEPRVLAWLAGDRKTLDLLRSGMSIYEAHARATMGWTGGVLKKEDAKLYALAKARVLGLGYGCGWEKFITVAMAMSNIDITEGDPEVEEVEDPSTGEVFKRPGYGSNSRRIVQEFRGSNRLITDLWGKLDDGIRRSVGEDFEMALPNGRVMRYHSVRAETRIEADKDGRPRRKTVFTAEVGGKRRQFYGGLLTENLVQATSRDVFGEHLLALDQPGTIDVLFSCHDEAVLEVDADVTACDIEHVMSKTPSWLPGCPIGAEAQEVKHYVK